MLNYSVPLTRLGNGFDILDELDVDVETAANALRRLKADRDDIGLLFAKNRETKSHPARSDSAVTITPRTGSFFSAAMSGTSRRTVSASGASARTSWT